jgi:hypothetical protein
MPIMFAMTMMAAENRVTGLFASQAAWIPSLSCLINALSASRPGARQTNLAPGLKMPGLCHPQTSLAASILPESAG